MINEQDVAEHAHHPAEYRFHLIERLARQRLTKARIEAGPNNWPEYEERDYMAAVLAAAEAFAITELLNWELPSHHDDEQARVSCQNFRAEATKVSQRLMLRYAGRPDPGSVALGPKSKQIIRFHLNQVRDTIEDQSHLADWVKEDLLGALAKLEHEIDKPRTPLGAVLETMANVLKGDAPIVDGVRKIITIIVEAKTKEDERAVLTAPAQPKQIEGPKRAIGFNKKIDDEIPF